MLESSPLRSNLKRRCVTPLVGLSKKKTLTLSTSSTLYGVESSAIEMSWTVREGKMLISWGLSWFLLSASDSSKIASISFFERVDLIWSSFFCSAEFSSSR